jgi:hypothetical protein
MKIMALVIVYDFMQVLNSTRKYYTSNEYFYRYIILTTIYLLREQKLNPRNYSKPEIIMSNFVHAKEYDMIMYENFPCLNMHLVL